MLNIQKDRLVVSGDKVFYTLQGEGKTIGKPAVFLRLKFCNLRCVWCDTKYAVFPEREDFKKEGESWTIDEAVKMIKQNDKSNCKRLVITGGEPLLQKEAIDNLIKQLPDWKIEIETNGTVMPTKYQLKRCQFNCSPKLSNSGNSYEMRMNQDVLKAMNKVNSVFKFVIMTEKDIKEMEKDFGFLDKDKIILMPEGITLEDNRKHLQNFVEFAKKKGYRVLPRLQIFIWGAKRAV